jgi:paraquat-inducible protein A
LIHRLPPFGDGQIAICTRCGATILHFAEHRTARRCAAAAIVALILFFPAILLPILEVEQLGHHHAASLLFGTIELLAEGSWFVGIVVLLFSIVFPLAKILLLLELSLLNLLHRRHKSLTYRLMEFVGKWSMMDVMLLAFLVMLVKLGDLVQFHLGPAVFVFVSCVAASMLASMFFDPHLIWEDD